MSFLGYNKGETLEFNYKKACGLWLIAVAFVIALATVVGGEQIINMQVFSIGYMVSFFSINLNKKVLHKFSEGPSTPFQRKVSLYSVILLFILLVLLGGPFFESENWRLIWLGALLATGIHFLPYYFVHGKSMIFLGLTCVINAAFGYLSPQTSLVTIAYIDAFIKLAFGVYLFFLSKPSKA